MPFNYLIYKCPKLYFVRFFMLFCFKLNIIVIFIACLSYNHRYANIITYNTFCISITTNFRVDLHQYYNNYADI